MPTKTITAEDLYRLQVLSSPQISPNGKFVIFSVQHVDRKSEKKYTNLWITSTETGKSRQFTFGDHVDVHPIWSPDGKEIAFLSNRQDKEKAPQLFILPFEGGEARPVTQIDGEINEMLWTPDGKKLVLSVRKTDQEVLDRKKDPDLSKLSAPVRHYNRLFYKLDGYGYLPLERTHIWTVDASTGKTKQLTDHTVLDESSLDVSPDGKWISYISNVTADPDGNPDHDDIFVMPIGGGEARKLKTPLGGKSSTAFSPDGNWIAYYAQEGVGEGYKNIDLWIVPTTGEQPAVNLTGTYDLCTGSWTINDIGGANTNPPAWSTDSKEIYFPVVLHGSSLMMRTTITDPKPESFLGEGGVVHSHSFDKARNLMAYQYGTMADPGQIAVYNFSTKTAKVLTKFNREIFDKVDLGQVEEVWFKGPDGNDLQGWIIKPPAFDPKKKYPSIMEIHGGPLTQYGFFFMHEFYYLAAQGYVVYFCNPRGGRGYGEKHAGAIHRDWGNSDYADLMVWADTIEKLPYIDKDRMGVTGGSYGGYMTVWIIGHTQRFKAAVAQRVVSNFVSMWGSSDFNWGFQQEINDKPPFEDLDNFWKHSPIAYIGNAKTPTLVIHSEMDLRCPIEQGEQVYVALKRLGVDSEFLRFPEEFHGLSRGGRTDRRIIRLNNIANWFKKYMA